MIASMLLHDFGLAEAAGLLGRWRRLAGRAVVVADVQRHWFPYAAIHARGRVSRSPLFGDGHARTVRRGLTPGELARASAPKPVSPGCGSVDMSPPPLSREPGVSGARLHAERSTRNDSPSGPNGRGGGAVGPRPLGPSAT